MARIAGVNVPDRKHAGIALTSIYGIGELVPFRFALRPIFQQTQSCLTLMNLSSRLFVVKLLNSSQRVICVVKYR